MKKLGILVALILFMLTSCHFQTKDINNECQEIIVETQEGKSLKLSDFFSDIDYLKLAYSESTIISKIEKIIYQDSKIFILDPNIKKVAIFSNNGEYVAQINNNGRGPGEYLNIADFLVDSLNKTIEIWDNGNHKVLKFDYRGNFLREKSLKLYVEKFCKLSSNIYVFFANNYLNKDLFGQNSYNALLLDSNYNLISSFLPIKKLKYLKMQNPNCFEKYRNGINVAVPFDNYIYHITSNDCSSIYKISFSNNSIPKNFFNEYSKVDQNDYKTISLEARNLMMQVNNNGYASGIHNIFENSKIFFFQYLVPKVGVYSVIYNKQNKKTFVGIPENNIDYGIFGEPLALLYDTLVTYIYPNALSARIKSLESNPTYDKTDQKLIILKKLSNSMEETGNPIIVKFKLRDF